MSHAKSFLLCNHRVISWLHRGYFDVICGCMSISERPSIKELPVGCESFKAQILCTSPVKFNIEALDVGSLEPGGADSWCNPAWTVLVLGPGIRNGVFSSSSVAESVRPVNSPADFYGSADIQRGSGNHSPRACPN